MKKWAVLCIVVLAAALGPQAALATNGMNMIGTGPVSTAMGGADVAVPAGCTAIAGNPAQLATTCNRVISAGGSFLFPSMTVKTGTGGVETDNEFQVFPLPFIGYAQRIGTTPWAAGIGLYAQGGMGVDFKDVVVAPGVKDKLYSEVAYLKLSPTVSYNVTNKLTLGASLFVGYSTLEYEFYPNLPQGQKVEGLNSFTFSGRFGVNYEINEKWSVGATYTTESAINFDNGDLIQNFGAFGKVKYRDAKMEDFTWPRQVEFGVAYRPIEKLLLAFDVSWINWSAAIKNVTVKASNPNGPVPPGYEELTVPFVLEWDDQWVFAIGAAYRITDSFTVRAGFNYGNNPVPSENLSPLFPAIVEYHATGGVSYTWKNWDFDLAYEHAFKNTETNDGEPSDLNPFAGTEVSMSQDTVSFMVSYRF